MYARKAPSQSRRRMFEVAIVCALQIESTAIEACLDDVYDATSYGKAPGDTNAYTLGRIGPHHVVLTYLPSIGKAPAAATAALLAISFDNIQLGLLVGICGAIPFIKEHGSTAEVALGDIIIGTGVVQYDLGRQYDVGRPIRKRSLEDSLSRSPPEIRSFLHKCQAGLERRAMQAKVQEYIEEICEKDDFKAWRKPALDQDILYEPDYIHQHRTVQHCGCFAANAQTCNQAREATCDTLGCSKLRTITRLRHAQPLSSASATSDCHIYWGLIASGDSVIKSARVRDAIAAEEHVIAFEMEGSGLWEKFPALIIKGVCDYADSHKNKTWQKYAALAAAAGAKALLNGWVPACSVPGYAEQYSKTVSEDNLANNSAASSRANRQTAPSSKATAWLVPFDPPNKLIGRSSEVEQAYAMLFCEGHYARTAVEGLGGIGKTRLALEVATMVRAKSNNASVFWMNCSSAHSFGRDSRKVIRYLEVPGAEDLAHDPKILMRQHLDQDNTRKWLIILDNADDEELWSAKAAAPSKLIDYIPNGRYGAVLVTTRNHRIAVDIAQRNIVKLAQLQPKDSRLMLQDLILEQPDILADAEKTTQLLDHLTHHPLAIVQAAAYMNQNNLDDIDQYLQIWNDQKEDEIMEVLSEEFIDNNRYQDAQNPVAKTWLISFNMIKAQYPLAVRVLSFMSCLDPKDMLQSSIPSFHASLRDRDKAFGTLKNYAFIQVQQRNSSDKTFDMHRLVHLAIRNYLRREGQFSQYVQLTAKHLLSLMPRSGLDMTSYWHKYLHHAERVVATVEIADEMVRVELLEVLANAYLAIGAFAKSLALRQSLIDCLEHRSDLEDTWLVRNLTALANTLIQQGRYQEALGTAQNALDLHSRSSSNNDLDRVPVMITLADANRCIGSNEKALQLSHQAVQIAEVCATRDGNSNTTTIVPALQILSSCYNSLRRYHDQEKALLRVIGLLRRSADPDRAMCEAELNMLLAGVYCRLEKADAAERLLIPAGRMFETHLGRLHRLTLRSVAFLGEVYVAQNRLSDAESLYRLLLSMYAEAGRLDDADVLRDRNCLMCVLVAESRHEEARDIQLGTISIAVRLSGTDSALTLRNVEILSWCYWRMGKRKLASGIMTDLARRSKIILGVQHSETQSRAQIASEWSEYCGRKHTR